MVQVTADRLGNKSWPWRSFLLRRRIKFTIPGSSSFQFQRRSGPMEGERIGLFRGRTEKDGTRDRRRRRSSVGTKTVTAPALVNGKRENRDRKTCIYCKYLLYQQIEFMHQHHNRGKKTIGDIYHHNSNCFT